MFPSKLYDSSFLRKCTSTDEITLFDNKNNQTKFQALLNQDSKELLHQTYSLYHALSQTIFGTTQKYQFLLEQCRNHLQFLCDNDLMPIKLQLLISLHDKLNDQILLHITSLLFKTKIVIYDYNPSRLECQIINFGFTRQIFLAKSSNEYNIVNPIGTTDRTNFCQTIIFDILRSALDIEITNPVSPPRHKRSFSDPFKFFSDQKDIKNFSLTNQPISPSRLANQFNMKNNQNLFFTNNDSSRIQLRDQYREEINQEGDLILQECNSIFKSEEPIVVSNDILSSLKINFPDNGQNIISKYRQTGTLKFYDDQKSYGFIIMDLDGTDIFVHQDDFQKAGVSKDLLRTAKQGNTIRFSFYSLSYVGKYNRSRKAVDLQVLSTSMFPYSLDQYA